MQRISRLGSVVKKQSCSVVFEGLESRKLLSVAPTAPLIDVDFAAAHPDQFGSAVIGSPVSPQYDEWNYIGVPFNVSDSSISRSDIPLFGTQGYATPVTLSFTAEKGYSGPGPFDGTPYKNLMGSYIIADQGTTGHPGTVTFNGLAPNGYYSLTVYSAANQTGRKTVFKLNGATKVVTFNDTVSTFTDGVNYTTIKGYASSTGSLTLTFDVGTPSSPLKLGEEADLNGIQLQQIVAPLVDVDFTADSPVQTGAAVIGGVGNEWNDISNPYLVKNKPPIVKTDLALTGVGGDTSAVKLSYTTALATHTVNGTGSPFKGTAWQNLMNAYLIADPTESYLDQPGPAGQVTLSGLTPGDQYGIYLYSGATTNGRETEFKLNGVTKTATFNTSVTKFEAGVNYVYYTFTAGPPGTVSFTFNAPMGEEADLNGLQLQELAV